MALGDEPAKRDLAAFGVVVVCRKDFIFCKNKKGNRNEENTETGLIVQDH